MSFNLGVEIGQALALSAMVLLLIRWRRFAGFKRQVFSPVKLNFAMDL
ncbi:MAG: HupE/UreJ family protein [Pseudomonadales bacterium]|nr:HupE/UreJ family protein [Pseudomonadales bacterium]